MDRRCSSPHLSSSSSPGVEDCGQYLPIELWVEVIARLTGPDIGQALRVQRSFAGNAAQIWRKACEIQFPHIERYFGEEDAVMRSSSQPMTSSSGSIVTGSPASVGSRRLTGWPARYQLLSLRAAEYDARAVNRSNHLYLTQSGSQHSIHNFSRAILVDFLTDTGAILHLDDIIVEKAVSILDYFLSKEAINVTFRLHLCGIACLHTAMQHHANLLSHGTIELQPQRFVELCAGCYSMHDILEEAALVSSSVPRTLVDAPTGSRFLRLYWAAWVHGQQPSAEHAAFVTMVSRTWLCMALIDAGYLLYPPSLVAAASLSRALLDCIPYLYSDTQRQQQQPGEDEEGAAEDGGGDLGHRQGGQQDANKQQRQQRAWPDVLAEYSGYSAAQVAACRNSLWPATIWRFHGCLCQLQFRRASQQYTLMGLSRASTQELEGSGYFADLQGFFKMMRRPSDASIITRSRIYFTEKARDARRNATVH